MRRSAMCVVTLTALLLASCAPVSQDRRYLGGKTFGPYVGQVVDAETRAPIEGAVSSPRGGGIASGQGPVSPSATPPGRSSRIARGASSSTRLSSKSMRQGGPCTRPSRCSFPGTPPSRPWQSGSPRGHS